MIKGKPSPRPKAMVIGLDGVTFDLIDPWIEMGHLPNLARLIHEGARTRLQSTIPAHSGPAWASFMTGLLPGNHGVYHFAGATRDPYYFRPLSSDSIRGKRFWDVAGEQGQTVGIINVPLTYPPQQVNGYMIAGLFAPNGEGAFYSKELYEEVLANCGEYVVSAPVVQNRRAFLDGLLDGMAGGLRVGEFLLDQHPTDLFVIVFRMIDSVMHRYWADMDPQHPLHADLGHSAVPDAILSGYRLLDEAVGRLVEKAGPDTTVFIMSDHGFRAEYRRFAVNKWLRDRGLLKLKGRRSALIGLAETWSERLKVEMILKRAGLRLMKILGYKTGRYEGFLYQSVDWSRTKVVYGPTQGLNINLNGRDHSGTVEPHEYEALRDWLIQEFQEIRDPATNLKVVKEIRRREEIYSGESMDLAPDLTITMADYETDGKTWAYGVAPGFWEGRDFPPPARRLTGEHAPDGILLAYGRYVQPGEIDDFHIVDLAPTVLYSMGLAVPRDLDGKVRREIFDPNYIVENPVQYAEQGVLGTDGSGSGMSADYDSAVTERLRELGYIE